MVEIKYMHVFLLSGVKVLKFSLYVRLRVYTVCTAHVDANVNAIVGSLKVEIHCDTRCLVFVV